MARYTEGVDNAEIQAEIARLQAERDEQLAAQAEVIKAQYNPAIRRLSAYLAARTRRELQAEFADALIPALQESQQLGPEGCDEFCSWFGTVTGIQYRGEEWYLKIHGRIDLRSDGDSIVDVWYRFYPVDEKSKYRSRRPDWEAEGQYQIHTEQWIRTQAREDNWQAVLTKETHGATDKVIGKIRQGWRPKQFHQKA